MRFITNLLLALVARNIQTLLDFITRVDSSLDSFIAKRDAEAEAVNRQVSQLINKHTAIRAQQKTARNLKTGLASLRA